MPKNPADQTIDAIIDDFDLAERASRENVETMAITIWLPVDKKKRFDELQGESRKRFGKLVKKVVEHTIDRVSEKKAS